MTEEKRVKQECLRHKDGVGGNLTNFTSTSWVTFKNAAVIRKDQIYEKLKDSLDGKPYGSYHRQCYQQYTHKNHLERLVRKRLQDDNPEPEASTSGIAKAGGKVRRVNWLSCSPVLPRLCIICNNQNKTDKKSTARYESLSQCETFEAGNILLEAARVRKDERIIVSLQDQDCISIELCYHRSCYRNYTNKKSLEILQRKSAEITNYTSPYDFAAQQIIDYVQEMVIDGYEIIRMSELKDMFIKFLKDKEVTNDDYRSYKLKLRLQKHFGDKLGFWHPRYRAESEIIFSDAIPKGMVVEQNLKLLQPETSLDQNGVKEVNTTESYTIFHVSKAVRSIIKETKHEFPWPPAPEFLNESSMKIPNLAYNMLAWMLTDSCEFSDEVDFKVPADEITHRRILSIWQDMIFTASKGLVKPPKHIALPVSVKSMTGSSELVTILNRLGHGISYTKLEEYETAIAEKQIERQQGGIVLPSNCQHDIPATLAWDNNDLLEETLSGRETTHCTNGIVIQRQAHPPSNLIPDNSITCSRRRSLKSAPLPLLPYVAGKRQNPQSLPLTQGQIALYSDTGDHPNPTDFGWFLCRLPIVTSLFSQAQRNQVVPGWTAFNGILCEENIPAKSIVGYAQVIDASPTQLPTVYNILKRSLAIADQIGQNDVIVVFDLAIYAKGLEIMWHKEEEMNRVVLRMGAFHMCCTLLAVIGKRFGDAGLSDILIESEVIAAGSLSGVLEGKHYNRGVRAHKIVFEALLRLRWEVFQNWLKMKQPEFEEKNIVSKIAKVRESFLSSELKDLISSSSFAELHDLYKEFGKEEPGAMGSFWNSYIHLVSLLLKYIRSTREGNWTLHVSSVREMLPWFHAYDRTNYARYASYYWADMATLEERHPDAYRQLCEGNFAVQRSNSIGFSQTPVDQTIEQTFNRDTKTKGGIIGFSLKKGAVERWVLTAHARATILGDLKKFLGLTEENNRLQHKECSKARLSRDEEDVRKVESTIRSWTNPFERNEDLINIASGTVAPDSLASDLLGAHKIGDDCAKEFIKNRIVTGSTEFFDPLPKNNLKTFSILNKKTNVNVKGKEEILVADRKLFGRLAVIAQSRSLNMQEVLQYTLGPVPWSLASLDGSLAKTAKSKLTDSLEKEMLPVDFEECPVWLFDGMALLQSVVVVPETFGSLAQELFDRMSMLAKNAVRFDFVVDQYPTISIKNAERGKRASKGTLQVKITQGSQKCPRQWQKFLSLGENKTQLAHFLFKEWSSKKYARKLRFRKFVVSHGEECHLLSVQENQIISEPVEDLFSNQEEADTRLLLHAKNAADEGHSKIIIKSSDVDVEVLFIHHAKEISASLFILSGTKSRMRYIDISQIVENLGDDICNALIGLHAFTGCDSVCAFVGKGKKAAFTLIKKQDHFCETMKDLGDSPEVSDDLFKGCEKFVCALYGGKGSDVNKLRYSKFCATNAQSSRLPPTKDALKKHTQRANYQAAVWKLALYPKPEMPSPNGHGWIVENDDIRIDWMDQLPAPLSVLEYISCRCTGNCSSGRCSCSANSLPCTDACMCGNKCENQRDINVADDSGTDEDN